MNAPANLPALITRCPPTDAQVNARLAEYGVGLRPPTAGRVWVRLSHLYKTLWGVSRPAAAEAVRPEQSASRPPSGRGAH